MSRRTKIAGTPESTENSEAGLLVDSPALLAPPSISGHITDSSMPRIAGGPFPRFSDPYAPPDPYCEGKPPLSFLGSLSRRRATKPLFAPPTAIQIGSISLVEQNRLFSSRKIKDVWKLFYLYRGHFPRPDEENRAVRNLCAEWKRKYKGESPRALTRFFQHCPELAVWADWVERAIHETQFRSTRNKSPRLDLLKQCVGILASAQIALLSRKDC